MKTLLFVNCCIRENSRTLRLAREYLAAVEQAGEFTVREVNVPALGLKPFDAAMLAARNADVEAGAMDKDCYQLARDWRAADRIVIAAPYWDVLFPAALKVYFEHVSVEGLTFAFGPGGRKKLCRADKMVYITSCGGPLGDSCALTAVLEELREMFAVGELSFHCAKALDSDPDHAEESLAAAAKGLLAAL